MYNKDPRKRGKGSPRPESRRERRTKNESHREEATSTPPKPAATSRTEPAKSKGCGALLFSTIAGSLVIAIITSVMRSSDEEKPIEDLIEDREKPAFVEDWAEDESSKPKRKAPTSVAPPVVAPATPTPVAKPKINPEITTQSALLMSDDTSIARKALIALQKFPEEKAAFEAICIAAEKHPDRYIRNQALMTMTRFKSFNPHPLCEKFIAASGDNLDMARRALNTVAAVQYYGYETILINVLDSPTPELRAAAADIIERKRITSAKDKLLKVARDDAEAAVRREAIQALALMKMTEVLPLLEQQLASTEQRERSEAMNHLMNWRSHSKALDILATHRDDPDYGTRITNHLTKYGR